MSARIHGNMSYEPLTTFLRTTRSGSTVWLYHARKHSTGSRSERQMTVITTASVRNGEKCTDRRRQRSGGEDRNPNGDQRPEMLNPPTDFR